MSILSIIGSSLKLFLMFMKGIAERDAERKAILKEASNEVKEGINKRDPSIITAGFDRARRV